METNINTVAAIIRDDHHMSVRMLESMVHISKLSIHWILSEHLQMCRVYSTWGPHFLMCEQMEWRLEVAKEWVQRVRRNGNFLSKVITSDKTWVHYFDPKRKRESEVWRTFSKDQKSKPAEIDLQGHIMRVFWRLGCHLPTCSFTEDKNKCRLLCVSSQIAPKTY